MFAAILMVALAGMPYFSAPAGTRGSGENNEIGPTIIPFYSGNLSVPQFMCYWGTGKAPGTMPVTDALIAQLHRCSCFAMCDYPAWCLAEPEPGRWDFSLYETNARRLAAASIRYVPFSWLHFPPKWFLNSRDFVGYRCLEHGQELGQLSLWAPATRRIYREYYRRLAAVMGPHIAFIRLAMPSEYGEVGYPVGMTNWLVPQKHVHPGFWCGDAYARRDFAAWALRRYGSIGRVNSAWGTDFTSMDAIRYPPIDGAKWRLPENVQARRRWLDFMEWYQSSWDDFIMWSASVVKRFFPGFGLPQAGKDLRTRREIIFSLGYGGETPCFGNDEGMHVKAIGRCGGSAQTPGDIGYFATRRVSTACAFYGVPYYTEPPGDVPREREVRRIWMDASNGTQVFFDYPQNLDAARDLFRRYKAFLDGVRSRTDVALIICTTTHWLHPEWGYPPTLLGIAEALRPFCDYEVVDEHMLGQGALDRLHLRVAVLADAAYMEEKALRVLEQWVRGGGILVTAAGEPVRNVRGSDAVWKRLVPNGVKAASGGEEGLNVRRAGRGAVVIVTDGDASAAAMARVVEEVRDEPGRFAPGAPPCCIRVDTGASGVLASVFRSRVLLYNGSSSPVDAAVRIVGGPSTVQRRTVQVHLGPHSILGMPLTQWSAE
ncbi:MAG: family 14 glycosylhydrolase [Chthonomonadales bacterium]